VERTEHNNKLLADWGLAAPAIIYLVRAFLGLLFLWLFLTPLRLSEYLNFQILDSMILITLVVLFLRWRRVDLNFLINPAAVPWSELFINGTMVGIGLLVLGNLGEAWVKANIFADLSPHPLYQLTVRAERPGQFILPFLVGAFLVPLAEEFFYRGILFPPLEKRLGTLWGIVSGGAIFALTHFTQAWLLEIFLVGVVLTYLFARFRSVIPGLIAHIILNGGRLIMIYLAV